MEPEPGHNLNLVLGAWLVALNERNPTALRPILDDDVVWEGRYAGQTCRTPEEVQRFLSTSLARGWRITRLEACEAGCDVILNAEGPDFEDVAPDGTRTPRPSAGMVFTVRNDRIVRMKGT